MQTKEEAGSLAKAEVELAACCPSIESVLLGRRRWERARLLFVFLDLIRLSQSAALGQTQNDFWPHVVYGQTF